MSPKDADRLSTYDGRRIDRVNLTQLQKTWNELGKRDAFWAVLTGPAGAPREWNLEHFLASGRDEIATMLGRVRELGMAVGKSSALDFGCGVGRLSQALARHFEHVFGLDIAPSMIEQAQQLNQHGDRCEYLVNDRDDLSRFPSGTFDLIYSNITFQHIPPELSRGYLREFLRVARPGGVMVFQIPSTPAPGLPPKITESTRRLPRRACRAEIMPETPRITCAPGALLPIVARIRNLGNEMWPARGDTGLHYAIHFGNHWRNRLGFMIKRDEARGPLPRDVEPGEEVEIGIWVKAPERAGQFVLELDMVQEQVRWFRKAGSHMARIRITVDPAAPAGTYDGIPAKMEMHGIERDEVVSIVEQNGGRILSVDPDDSPGPQWISYRYYATKT
jgi:SAM-dependent methyltransferase